MGESFRPAVAGFPEVEEDLRGGQYHEGNSVLLNPSVTHCK